jgi:hypothetical protein
VVCPSYSHPDKDQRASLQLLLLMRMMMAYWQVAFGVAWLCKAAKTHLKHIQLYCEGPLCPT